MLGETVAKVASCKQLGIKFDRLRLNDAYNPKVRNDRHYCTLTEQLYTLHRNTLLKTIKLEIKQHVTTLSVKFCKQSLCLHRAEH